MNIKCALCREEFKSEYIEECPRCRNSVGEDLHELLKVNDKELEIQIKRTKALKEDLTEARLLYKEAKEEIDRLKLQLNELADEDNSKAGDLIWYKAKLTRYETALKQYADENNWNEETFSKLFVCEIGPEIAQEALKP